MSQSAADEIKKIILEKMAERDELKKRISGLDSEVHKLNDTYRIITGDYLLKKSDKKPVLDYVEEILKKYERLHLSDILRILDSSYNIQPPSQSVSSGLIRFHNQGKRFQRVAPGTFALLPEKEEKEEE